MGTSVLSWGQSRQSMMVTTHLHLVLRQRMGAAIPVPLLYAFMAQTKANLPLVYSSSISAKYLTQDKQISNTIFT
jgi:hypothetical protein